MTKEDIIRIAWSANLLQVEFSTAIQEMWVSQLERFANLIAAEEREACAKVAEAVVPRHTECGNKIAGAIRARGQHD